MKTLIKVLSEMEFGGSSIQVVLIAVALLRMAIKKKRRGLHLAFVDSDGVVKEMVPLPDGGDYRYECSYCQKHLRKQDLEMDHIIPKSRGGSDDEENLAESCGPCNRSKGTKTAREFLNERPNRWGVPLPVYWRQPI